MSSRYSWQLLKRGYLISSSSCSELHLGLQPVRNPPPPPKKKKNLISHRKEIDSDSFLSCEPQHADPHSIWERGAQIGIIQVKVWQCFRSLWKDAIGKMYPVSRVCNLVQQLYYKMKEVPGDCRTWSVPEANGLAVMPPAVLWHSCTIGFSQAVSADPTTHLLLPGWPDLMPGCWSPSLSLVRGLLCLSLSTKCFGQRFLCVHVPDHATAFLRKGQTHDVPVAWVY